MDVTVDKLREILPKADTAWLEALASVPPQFGIDTPAELSSFIAQLAHESRGLTAFEESFDYTPERALAIFNHYRQRLTPEEAEMYCRTAAHPANQPMLASIVYENMMGNGPRATLDGWKNRGMGPIQITGHNNRVLCEADTGLPLTSDPELLLQPVPGITSACWFWRENGLDLLDDDMSVAAETRKVNGGEHGLPQRQAWFDKAYAALIS